jgi:hypothetical protein
MVLISGSVISLGLETIRPQRAAIATEDAPAVKSSWRHAVFAFTRFNSLFYHYPQSCLAHLIPLFVYSVKLHFELFWKLPDNLFGLLGPTV